MSWLDGLRGAFGPAPVLRLQSGRTPTATRVAVPRVVQAIAIPGDAMMLAAARESRKRNVLTGQGANLKLGNYNEPSARVFVTWTPEQRRAAIQMADAGTLIRAADMCEAMLGDDRIPAVWGTRSNALLGCELDFEDGTGEHEKAKREEELNEDWWQMFPEEELARLVLWGRMLGVGIAQLCYGEPDPKSGRLLPRLQVWHPRFLRWSWPDRKWYLRVQEYGVEIEINPGDGKWVLYMPYGSQRPWSMGMWRGMSLMWLLKLFALRDWALHSEIHGSPIRLGTMAPVDGTEYQKGTDAVRKELADDIDQIGNDTTLVLPAGFDLKLVEAKARTWEMFQAQVSVADAAFSVMAIGSNLPTEVKAAVSTGATAATLVRNDYTQADGKTLSTCLHEQALPVWAMVNFGPKEDVPWGRWLTEPPIDQAALSLTWQQASNAVKTLVDAGFTPTKDQLKDKFDMEVEEAPQPPPGQAPAGGVLPPGGAQPPTPGTKVAPRGAQGPQLASKAGGPKALPAATRVAAPQGGQLALLGYGIKGTRQFAGLPVAIENRAGDARRWRDDEGRVTGETLMRHDYGFIEGHMGSDGEELDCYLGPDESAQYVYVVHQLRSPKFDGPDEDKVMLGWPDPTSAKEAYLAHRNDGERAFGGMSTIPLDQFKLKLKRRMGQGKIRANMLSLAGAALGALVLLGTADVAAGHVRRSAATYVTTKDGTVDDRLSERARAIIATGIQRGNTEEQIAAELRTKLGARIDRPESYWALVAQVSVARADAFAALTDLQDQGLDRYTWEATVDARTCAGCLMMNGREFSVGRALARMEAVAQGEHGDVVDLQPWLRTSGKAGDREVSVQRNGRDRVLSTEDEDGDWDEPSDELLARNGVLLPPAHGNCRCQVVPS